MSKKRLGFVSNSSSSSFLLGCTKEFTKEEFKKFILNRPELTDRILNKIIDRLVTGVFNGRCETIKEYVDDYGEMTDFAQLCINRGCELIRCVNFSNEYDGIDFVLCDSLEINHDEVEIVIQKDASY